MSESQLETDLTAQTAAVQALGAEVTSGLASNAAAIAALQAQVAAGQPVTAAGHGSRSDGTRREHGSSDGCDRRTDGGAESRPASRAVRLARLGRAG